MPTPFSIGVGSQQSEWSCSSGDAEVPGQVHAAARAGRAQRPSVEIPASQGLAHAVPTPHASRGVANGAVWSVSWRRSSAVSLMRKQSDPRHSIPRPILTLNPQVWSSTARQPISHIKMQDPSLASPDRATWPVPPTPRRMRHHRPHRGEGRNWSAVGETVGVFLPLFGKVDGAMCR